VRRLTGAVALSVCGCGGRRVTHVRRQAGDVDVAVRRVLCGLCSSCPAVQGSKPTTSESKCPASDLLLLCCNDPSSTICLMHKRAGFQQSHHNNAANEGRAAQHQVQDTQGQSNDTQNPQSTRETTTTLQGHHDPTTQAWALAFKAARGP